MEQGKEDESRRAKQKQEETTPLMIGKRIKTEKRTEAKQEIEKRKSENE